MRSLTLPSGLKNSPFSAMVAPTSRADAVELDQGRAAHGADDIRMDWQIG
jgi:hypothetical protein